MNEKATSKSNFQVINGRIIAFEEVVNRFKIENNLFDESTKNNRTLFLLSVANSFFGSWVICELPAEQVKKIVLPHHKHLATELVSTKGLFLKNAIKKLEKMFFEYELKNDCCVQIIESFKSRELTTVYLSLNPLIDRNNRQINSFKEYRNLQNRIGLLIHLDGLHKLLYWGRYDGKSNLRVIVACRENSSIYQQLNNGL
jgi:Family of unknown function (DUF6309)